MATKRKMEDSTKEPCPVTLLAGFLGSGKSTLLKHILECKRAEEDGDGEKFRCAVIVNDMAELNIDGTLIESTGLIQSNEVVTMQNGCVCCNLSGDLVTQMTTLAKQTSPYKFDYMIIEASGVSEPAAVAALFKECEEDHDHDGHGDDDVALSEVAKLDTLVTVVDCAQFFHNLGMQESSTAAPAGAGDDTATTAASVKLTAPRLLMDQVEYSNVILLNKTDLVSESQLEKVREHVVALNSKAKIISCRESSVDVADVVNTGRFNADDFDLDNFSKMFESQEKPKGCCKASIARGESPCCLRARTVDSGISKVLLPQKKAAKTRHNQNYEITSLVYKARRPFNTAKFHEEFITPYFVMLEDDDDDDDDEEEEEACEIDDANGDEEMKTNDDDDDEAMQQKQLEEKMKLLQEEGTKKMMVRGEHFGTLLRMKGYLWQASAHDLVGYVSVAGNMARLESPGPWNCLDAKAYTGTPVERARLRNEWMGEYGDRRQELVFIGRGMKHAEIQKVLDGCLLSDDEMALGVDGWKAVFGDIMLQDH